MKKIEQHKRYFTDVDDGGNFYLIPVEFKQQWNEYVNLPMYDEDGNENEEIWNVPEYAIEIGGIHRLTFENPVEE